MGKRKTITPEEHEEMLLNCSIKDIENKISLEQISTPTKFFSVFVFVQRDYGYKGKLYEIIDGKQRLTALLEFNEDRFQYNGYYFSELSNADKNKF